MGICLVYVYCVYVAPLASPCQTLLQFQPSTTIGVTAGTGAQYKPMGDRIGDIERY